MFSKPASSAHKSLPLKEKVELLKDLTKMTQREVAMKWEVSIGQVNNLAKKRTQIEDEFNQGCNLKKKRNRPSPQEDIRKALFIWFENKLAQGTCISGPLLKEKALELAAEKGLDKNDFVASDGWLSWWKTHYNVVFKKEQGEKASANMSAAENWTRNVLPEIIETYGPDDLYNCDETGLYFRELQNGGHVLQGQDLNGAKKAMARVTVLLCANMSGTNKNKLMIAGTAARPRRFPRNLDLLPVDYCHSKNAWMTSKLFLD